MRGNGRAGQKGKKGGPDQNQILGVLDEIFAEDELRMGPYKEWIELPSGIIVKPYINEKATPVHIFGPQDDKANKLETHSGIACGATISTYPKGQGEPICDHFEMELYTRRWMLALADGCSWGHASREAALRASTACLDYMRENQRDIRDVREAGRLILRGFAKAHQKIVQGYDDLLQAGTTTLLSGIMLELDIDESVQSQLKEMEIKLFEQAEKFRIFDIQNLDEGTRHGSILLKHEEPFEYPESLRHPDTVISPVKNPKPTLTRPSGRDYQYMFVCASVGDCKCFRYSAETGIVTDITHGNRTHINDPKDPGGRLGPYIDESDPDLRNLGLYIVPCYENDVFFTVSDGIHDNLDPQNLGIQPKDLGGHFDDWDTAEKNDLPWADGMKTQFRCQYLKRLVEQACGENGVVPELSTEKLYHHAYRLTQYSRDFMEQYPHLRLPEDYVLYPGKMDHTSCVSMFAAGRLLPRSFEHSSIKEQKPTKLEWDAKEPAGTSLYSVMPTSSMFHDVPPQSAAKMTIPVYSMDKTLLSSVAVSSNDLITDLICQVKHKLERQIEGRPFRLRKGDIDGEKKALPVLKKDFSRRAVDYFGERDIIVVEIAAGSATSYTSPSALGAGAPQGNGNHLAQPQQIAGGTNYSVLSSLDHH